MVLAVLEFERRPVHLCVDNDAARLELELRLDSRTRPKYELGKHSDIWGRVRAELDRRAPKKVPTDDARRRVGAVRAVDHIDGVVNLQEERRALHHGADLQRAATSHLRLVRAAHAGNAQLTKRLHAQLVSGGL